MRLTETNVGTLPAAPDKSHTYYRDGVLVLSVTPAGTRSFSTTATIGKKTKRIHLGKWPALKVAQARKLAEAKRNEAANGGDPTEQKRIAGKRAELTVAAALEEYLQARLVKGGRFPMKDSSKDDYRKKLRLALGDHMDRSVSAIDEDVVARCNKRSTANATGLRVGSALFNWLMHAHPRIIPTNPFKSLRVKRELYQAPRKTNHIEPARIAAFVAALPAGGSGALVWFLLLCGTRISETLALRWRDVDLDAATFNLLDPKNRTDAVLPLPQSIASRLAPFKGEADELVFAGVNQRAVFDKLDFAGSDGERITAHDLRRTFLSLGNSLDISFLTLKRLANHATPADVTASYVQHDLARLRAASDRIEGEIARLTAHPPLKLVAA